MPINNSTPHAEADYESSDKVQGMHFHIKGHSKPVYLADLAFIDFKTMQPVSGKGKSALWADIKAGRWPKGVLIGPNSRRWTVKSVREKLEELAAQSAQHGDRHA